MKKNEVIKDGVTVGVAVLAGLGTNPKTAAEIMTVMGTELGQRATRFVLENWAIMVGQAKDSWNGGVTATPQPRK